MNSIPVLDCQHVQPLLGISALGLTTREEDLTVAEHCERCADCTTDLDELTTVVPLLATVDTDDATAGLPEPRPDLLRRIIAETRHDDAPVAAAPRLRHMPRRVFVASGLLAAAALMVALTPWNNDQPDSSAAGGVVVASAVDPRSGIEGRFTITSAETGSEVSVDLSGVQPGWQCQLLALGEDGRREVAATWAVQYDGKANFTGHTSLRAEDIAGLSVVTLDGRTLLRVSESDLHARG